MTAGICNVIDLSDDPMTSHFSPPYQLMMIEDGEFCMNLSKLLLIDEPERMDIQNIRVPATPLTCINQIL